MDAYYKIKAVFTDGGYERYMSRGSPTWDVREERAGIYTRLEVISYVERWMSNDGIREITIILLPKEDAQLRIAEGFSLWR
jgi:hypothetical protein